MIVCIVHGSDVADTGRMNDTLQSRILQPKRVPISYDYRLSSNVLGFGINGKVIECFSKANGQKYALKVSIV